MTRVVELDEVENVAAKAKDQPAEPVSIKESTTIKEVKPIRKVKVNNNAQEEVDAREPPAKIAAGGK